MGVSVFQKPGRKVLVVIASMAVAVILGGTAWAAIGSLEGEVKSITDQDDLIMACDMGGKFRLTADIKLDSAAAVTGDAIVISSDVEIDPNGKTITVDSSYAKPGVFQVTDDALFSLSSTSLAEAGGITVGEGQKGLSGFVVDVQKGAFTTNAQIVCKEPAPAGGAVRLTSTNGSEENSVVNGGKIAGFVGQPGVLLENAASFTLGKGSVIDSCGNGLMLNPDTANGARFTMEEQSEIRNCSGDSGSAIKFAANGDNACQAAIAGTIHDCAATEGAAVYICGATVTLDGGFLTNNQCNDGPSAVCVFGQKGAKFPSSFVMTGENALIDSNSNKSGKGSVGVLTDGEGGKADFQMGGGTISNSKDYTIGGAVWLGADGTMAMTGGTILGEDKDLGNGKCVYIDDAATGASFDLSGGTLCAGLATFGGCIYAGNGKVSLSSGTVTGASPEGGINGASFGGLVYATPDCQQLVVGTSSDSAGSMELSYGDAEGDALGNLGVGGGIYTAAQVCQINASASLSNCSASDFGGAVFVAGGKVSADGAQVADNAAGKDGGAFYICPRKCDAEVSFAGDFGFSGNAAGGNSDLNDIALDYSNDLFKDGANQLSVTYGWKSLNGNKLYISAAGGNPLGATVAHRMLLGKEIPLDSVVLSPSSACELLSWNNGLWLREKAQ